VWRQDDGVGAIGPGLLNRYSSWPFDMCANRLCAMGGRNRYRSVRSRPCRSLGAMRKEACTSKSAMHAASLPGSTMVGLLRRVMGAPGCSGSRLTRIASLECRGISLVLFGGAFEVAAKPA
jgi:hypothetical protein